MEKAEVKNSLLIRKAEKEDTALVLDFIKALAEYERMSEDVETTVEILEESLFGPKSPAEAVIAYYDEKPAGFALYFYNFSTFVGRKGLYLEDLFVKPELRGKGIGKALLQHLAKIAKQQNCGRFEWAVLDWNTPSINFYKSLGAKPMDEWTIFRLSGEDLNSLASTF